MADVFNSKPDITKSSRHSKITGDFAEYLVLYWLSKHGFESALVDHVGLDLISRNPHDGTLMGISVKSRSRNLGAEGTYLSIPNENLIKLEDACQAFGCVPYFALVIDEADEILVFILSKKHLIDICPPGARVISWKMSNFAKNAYTVDTEIMRFCFSTKTENWWVSPKV